MQGRRKSGGILHLVDRWILQWQVVWLVCAVLGLSTTARAQIDPLVGALHEPALEKHLDQANLVAWIAGGQFAQAFHEAFDHGDELFETHFNALDGVGANVGGGHRFTRMPRADLNGPTQWANHFPSRATGPNAESCNSCHAVPNDDGAGAAVGNVHRDPLHSGSLGLMIQRNTPHTFGLGGVQRLAEEMSGILQSKRDAAIQNACSNGGTIVVPLVAKGVSFGSLSVTRTGTNPCVTTIDTSNVVGISTDLVVRPFQWKGSVAFLRDFNRGACHNELGMQAVELVGDDTDGDFDGVENELSIGDQTALAVYLAAQPRPTSKLELAALGLATLSPGEALHIANGRVKFAQAGCASCHVPVLKIDTPIFSEPSQRSDYRDAAFPAGQSPLANGIDPALAVRFDLTRDQPDNRILFPNGALKFHLGAFRKDLQGRAVVELFGDLKRHDLGAQVAEPIDEVGTGASTFLTENLWGVGSTGPYLHDSSATTLTEAILAHGGEATASRTAFQALSTQAQTDVIAFLDNLVLFKLPED